MDKEAILKAYKTMVSIRETEESFVPYIQDGTIKCPCHLCSGQEAVSVGICSGLDKSDYIFGNHRSHGHFIAKGGDVYKLIAEIHCREDGCSRGRGGSMHLVDASIGMLGSVPIVAGTISLALGAAVAAKNAKKGQVAVCFFGDGATGEGVFAETLNFASLKKSPLIFVCENNLYSTHMPIDEIRSSRDIGSLAEVYGVKTISVDGNNILEMIKVGKEAKEHAASGKGPVFIEAKTYRQRGHVGPDDNIQGTHTDIRPKEEIKKWLAKDPITFARKYILDNDFATESQLDAIVSETKELVHQLHLKAIASPKPKKEDLNRYVFSN